MNNYLASDSETFDSDAFDTRLDGRLHERLNLFGRYSLADFRRIGPTAFGPGGGPAFVTLGGTSKSRNHSLALGGDATFSPMTVADFRVGFFRYKVDVRSAASGMPAAPDPTIPGLNLDALSSGLPEGFIDGPGGFVFGFGGGANSCNCPLVQDEKQLQLVGNLTHQRRDAHAEIWRRRAPRIQPARRERTAAAGCALLQREPDPRTRRGRSRARQLPARRCHVLLTDDQPDPGCARAAVAPLLLRARHLAAHAEADPQLRPAPRGHQPADASTRLDMAASWISTPAKSRWPASEASGSMETCETR